MDTLKAQKKSARHAFNKALALREAESKVICKKIQESSGRDRYDAWNEKRSYGDDTRGLLLASGFVRGIPYKVIEAKVGERREAYAFQIVDAAKRYADIALDGNAVVDWLEGVKPEKLFAEPEPVVAAPVMVAPAPVAAPVPEPPKSATGFVAGIKRLFGAA